MTKNKIFTINFFLKALHNIKKKCKLFCIFSLFIASVLLSIIVVSLYATVIYPFLPNPTTLKDVTYKVPLRVVSSEGDLISEIGTEKRIPLSYKEIPEVMINAIVSAEDQKFFEHGGIDLKGIARAVFQLITTGRKKSGGSTITMQVARNFFLTKEKSYKRKIKEIMLAHKMEQSLSKAEILELYINKIFLGYRSYGVAAAAQVYYGKDIQDLSLDEFAMIAGLPKAPSKYNPIRNPERAKKRRNYVLSRMYSNNYITEDELQRAQSVEVHAKSYRLTGTDKISANYIAEMARNFVIKKYGKESLTKGLTVVTTLKSKLQKKAKKATNKGLQEYDRRHGYRGSITSLTPYQLKDKTYIEQIFKITPKYANLKVGIVFRVSSNQVWFELENSEQQIIDFKTTVWANEYIDVNKKGKTPKSMEEILKVGDVIYVEKDSKNQWLLSQNPLAEVALISIDPKDGSILALVGGYDYFRSKFNRVTQAKRQVGSNIKPLLYSAALKKGLTAATIINDAPVVFDDDALEEVWRPENYSGRFYGPTRLRKALTYSRNLVSIRILNQIGIQYAINHMKLFNLPKEQLNKHRDLSLALGSVQLTPLELVRAYAVFANQGYLVKPHFIKQVLDIDGNVIYQSEVSVVCKDNLCSQIKKSTNPIIKAPRVITEQNAYIMTSLMQDVIKIGTARAALSLDRKNIAGKTGTTNEQKDAWFSGFTQNVSTTVWVGFDNPKTLGKHENAGSVALPIWINYMHTAIKEYIDRPFKIPDDIVNIPIDKETGKITSAENPNVFFEIFRKANAPKESDATEDNLEDAKQELFE